MNRETTVECPSCSPDKKVPHEVLRAAKKLVIRCTACQTTQQVEPPHPTGHLTLKVVVSDYDKSHLRWLEVGALERLQIGDEVVAENSSVDAVRITAIELADGVRTAEAKAETIRVLWAQKIDKVIVKIAVHTRKTTRSYKVPFDGGREFFVGSEERLGRVVRIKIKNGPVLGHTGQCALAKDIARMYVEGRRDRDQMPLTTHKLARRRQLRHL